MDATNVTPAAATPAAASASTSPAPTMVGTRTFDNSKSEEFFSPSSLKGKIHIIGCGAVGGAIAELLARLGVQRLTLWDFDTVEAHNLGNQIFRDCDIKKPKTETLAEILHSINPEMDITIKNQAVTPESQITGYVFLCVDSIDVRRELCTSWERNPDIIFVSDGRMRLTDGQTYAAEWGVKQERKNLIASMQFTHAEAKEETPVSACGSALSVICMPRMIACLIVANWIRFCNTGNYCRAGFADVYRYYCEGFAVKDDTATAAPSKTAD